MDKTYLICKPVSEGGPPLPSTSSFCRSCGQAIWISNAEYRPGVPDESELICVDCGLQHMITSDSEPNITIPQEQLDAMGLSDKDAEELIERWGKMVEHGKGLSRE